MREDTIGRKKASHLFQEFRGRGWLLGRMLEVISEGKRGLVVFRGRFPGSFSGVVYGVASCIATTCCCKT